VGCFLNDWLPAFCRGGDPWLFDLVQALPYSTKGAKAFVRLLRVRSNRSDDCGQRSKTLQNADGVTGVVHVHEVIAAFRALTRRVARKQCTD
jgi:hypothetical protein